MIIIVITTIIMMIITSNKVYYLTKLLSWEKKGMNRTIIFVFCRIIKLKVGRRK